MSNEIDLSEYEPDWRGDVHKNEEQNTRGIYLCEEVIEHLKPLDEILPGEMFVTGGDVLNALIALSNKHNNTGPFSFEEVEEAVNEIVIEEINKATKSLQEKGILDENQKPTELGEQIIKDMHLRNEEEPE